jgi:hypothetical protein
MVLGHHLSQQTQHMDQCVPCAAGFVLGKPFWGIPGVEPINPSADTAGKAAAAAAAAAADPGEGVLEGDDLASKHISIPGMDGFFIYQIHFKTVRRGCLLFVSSADGVIWCVV